MCHMEDIGMKQQQRKKSWNMVLKGFQSMEFSLPKNQNRKIQPNISLMLMAQSVGEFNLI